MNWTSEPDLSVLETRKLTHDPMSNPNAHLYYECQDCTAMLDPGTKSFAALNTFASNSDWFIHWSPRGDGYEAFCPVCYPKRGFKNECR